MAHRGHRPAWVRPAAVTGTLLLVALAVLWALPILLGWMLGKDRPAPEAPAAVAVDARFAIAADDFMSETLSDVTGARLVAREETNGVIGSLYQLPPTADTAALARSLRRAAASAGVELYAQQQDGLDLEVRVYAGPELRHQALLVPPLPSHTDAPTPRTLRERPLVALVITGLGDIDASQILATKAPLTVAIRPFGPFSMRTARDGLLLWHEVLAQPAPGDTMADAMAAVPWSTGLLFDRAPGAWLPPGQLHLLVHDGDAIGSAPAGWRALVARPTERMDMPAALARTRFLALRDGVAVLRVDAQSPDLAVALRWAEDADAHGYRMVLASEAARHIDVVGQPSLDPPPATGYAPTTDSPLPPQGPSGATAPATSATPAPAERPRARPPSVPVGLSSGVPD